MKGQEVSFFRINAGSVNFILVTFLAIFLSAGGVLLYKKSTQSGKIVGSNLKKDRYKKLNLAFLAKKKVYY